MLLEREREGVSHSLFAIMQESILDRLTPEEIEQRQKLIPAGKKLTDVRRAIPTEEEYFTHALLSQFGRCAPSLYLDPAFLDECGRDIDLGTVPMLKAHAETIRDGLVSAELEAALQASLAPPEAIGLLRETKGTRRFVYVDAPPDRRLPIIHDGRTALAGLVIPESAPIQRTFIMTEACTILADYMARALGLDDDDEKQDEARARKHAFVFFWAPAAPAYPNAKVYALSYRLLADVPNKNVVRMYFSSDAKNKK